MYQGQEPRWSRRLGRAGVVHPLTAPDETHAAVAVRDEALSAGNAGLVLIVR